MHNRWLGVIITLFGRNWITLFGAALTTASAICIIGFLLLGFSDWKVSPYLDILALLILPGLFVTGLAVIPVGAWWDRRRRRREGETAHPATDRFPVVDLNNPNTRRAAFLVIVLTAVNIVIISTVTYHGVHFMDSVTFCGTVCHTVMEPEYAAYMGSPHSRVKCVECHIGPGAPWFVRSKLSGLGQVIAVTFGTYHRPIPTPVENLRPSQDTCEQCHWPEKFTGDRVRVITKFLEDEENTPTKTVLLMHIGGGASEHHGIHSWHIDPNIRTTYIPTDESRQKIAYVRVEKSDGTVQEFKPRDAEIPAGKERIMDCIDCHNRPTHIFQMPDAAVDEALAKRRIDRSIPYIKKVGTEALLAAKGNEEDLKNIVARVHSHYRENYPDFYSAEKAKVEEAADELARIYKRNVFPHMKVTWGTYPDNIGHLHWPGCTRCHDDSLVTATGETISGDCSICHTVLAWDETEPKILEELQIQ